MEAKLTLYNHDVRVIAPEYAEIGDMLGLLAQSVSQSTTLLPMWESAIAERNGIKEIVVCKSGQDPRYMVLDLRAGEAVAFSIQYREVIASGDFAGMTHRVRHVVSRADDPRF